MLTRHRHTLRSMGIILFVLPALAEVHGTEPQGTTRLRVRDAAFTINDQPTFLLGCSYYGALGADTQTWKADLDDIQRAGFNWIRCWATWNAFGSDFSAVDSEGRLREPYFEKLKSLIAECDRRGMVVDVTLTRGNGSKDLGRIATQAAHLRAVETLVTGLAGWQNWYLDLANERNIRDSRYVSFEELKALRARVRELDAGLLVTASHGGDPDNDELRKYIVEAGVDFVCPHRPRDQYSPKQTEQVTREWNRAMQELGRVVPVHYQEPFRRGYPGFIPQADDYETDLRGAIAGGAAGWCFHNGSTRGAADEQPRRSFDLSRKRLFESLDEVEREVVPRLQDQKPAIKR